jgi:ferredoxin, 2Fe-2S
MLDLAFDVREKSRLSCQIRVTADLDGLVLALPGTKTGW